MTKSDFPQAPESKVISQTWRKPRQTIHLKKLDVKTKILSSAYIKRVTKVPAFYKF